jgi:hypothetical protein
MNISVGKFTDIFNTEHKRKKNELNFGKNYFPPEYHRKRLERKKSLVNRNFGFLLFFFPIEIKNSKRRERCGKRCLNESRDKFLRVLPII